jgi:hypothetical protein
MDIFLAILAATLIGLPFALFMAAIFQDFATWVKEDAEYWRSLDKEPTPLPPVLHTIFKDCQKGDNE